MWSSFLDLSEDSSSSVLNKLQMSKRRKQHKNGDIIKTSEWFHFQRETSHVLALMSTSVLWDFSVLSAWECLESSLSLVMFFTTCDKASNTSHYQNIYYYHHHHSVSSVCVPPTCLKASPSSSLPAFWAIFSRAAALLALFFTLIRQESRQTSRRNASRPSRAIIATYSVSSLGATEKGRGRRVNNSADISFTGINSSADKGQRSSHHRMST